MVLIRDGRVRACVGILSLFGVPSGAGALLHRHCYSRAVWVPVGFIALFKFSAMYGRGALLFETCIVSCEIRLKKSYGGRNMK